MPKKTENDAYLARPLVAAAPTQLALPLPVESVPPLTPLQEKQRANFEALCLNLRQETALKLAIAQATFPGEGYISLKDVKTDHWAEVNRQYDSHPLKVGPVYYPHPGIITDYKAEAEKLFADRVSVSEEKPKAKDQQVYKPWSLERRQQHGARALLAREKKKSSFPEFWMAGVFTALAVDPWRYGVCPLPSEGSCPIPDPERLLSRQRAIAREIQFREQEQGLVMPISIPMPIPEIEREYALLPGQELQG